MPDRYTLILRECSEAGRVHVASFLSKAFSLKESTCATIAESAPIALLADLTRDEAAVLQLVLAGIAHDGTTVEYAKSDSDDLPKIDWPRRPLVFKREIGDYITDFRLPLQCPDCSRVHPVLDLLIQRLERDHVGSTSAVYRPHDANMSAGNAATPAPMPIPAVPAASSKEFRGATLPEITPFSNQALPSGKSPTTKPTSGIRAATQAPAPNVATPPPAAINDDDPVARLNELFPDDPTANFIPDNSDITSILNRLLPDEDGASGGAATAANSGSSRLSVPTSGYSVFLAKIGDDARRQKAVPVLAELAKITAEEADVLSKKVIIPVLKGASKEEAEAAKQRFAKIGILARIKGAAE